MSDETTRTSDGRCEKIDCAAALRQLWDYLDGELTPERVAAVRAHLEGCRRCHPHYDFERAFLEALASTRPDCRCPGELKAKVLESLRAVGFEG
jgi:anti-sigma factor (TIGR02949 family)